MNRLKFFHAPESKLFHISKGEGLGYDDIPTTTPSNGAAPVSPSPIRFIKSTKLVPSSTPSPSGSRLRSSVEARVN